MIAQPQILDNFKLFAGADINRSTTATAGTIASPGILAQGEIVITDAGNVILDTATVLNAPAIKIVMGRGANKPLWQSQLFTAADIKSYRAVTYTPKIQQVTYVGYNAVTNTGAFDVINDNYYTLVVSFYELLSQEASSLMNPIVVEYLSDATATQEEIVSNLYKQLCLQLKSWSSKPILAEMVSSAASLALTGTATTVTFSKGSKTVVGNGTLATFAVGDYIRVSTDPIVDDLDPVYKIVAIPSPTTLVLDVPFQGDDFVAPVAQVQSITAAAIAVSDLGIRLTGINQPFVLDSRPYGLVTFHTGLKDGGSTPIVIETPASIGHGTFEQIRTLEAASWRNQGQIFVYTEFPPTTVETDITNSNEEFSTLDIVLVKPVQGLNIGEARAQLTLACAVNVVGPPHTFLTNFVGATTSAVSVLDAYVTNFTNFTAQAVNL